MDSPNVFDIVRRTYRYWYDDGFAEMGSGMLFLATGLALQAWSTARTGMVDPLWLVAGVFLFTIGGVLLTPVVIGALKQRVTYSRTGYVGYRQRKPARRSRLYHLLALGVWVLFLLLPPWFSQMALVEGLILATVLFGIGWRIRIARFFVLGAICALLGILLATQELGDLRGTSLMFSGAGLALLISGAAVFGRYLRRNPRPVGGEHE